ncbi:MAG: uracil-DNA glycosylase, partial [Chloroflexi bacterium]|nr:uracil-DNA glycosylase [Chloroflexota bacterium]
MTDSLSQIASEIAKCEKCKLYSTRKRTLPGEGPDNAKIMFIGEGPGYHENEQGRPFVGQAGKFLDELLASIKMKRADVFIANVVKCRPPQNRDPEPDELASCNDYLERQIALINPKAIVTLGRYSMEKFFPGAKVSSIHGQAKKVKGRLVVAMFHPAAALHQPKYRSMIEEDFKKLPEYIAQAEKAVAATPAKPEEPPQQMSLLR